MHKKILMTCVSLVAFAAMAVVPAIAAASPELQTSAGAKVAAGTAISGSSSNLKFTSAAGSITCARNLMVGSITTNSGTTIAGDINEAFFDGGEPKKTCTTTILCPSGNACGATVNVDSLPWCLHSSELGKWTLRGGTCNQEARALKYTISLKDNGVVVATCKYERASLSGTNNTGSSPLVLTIGASQTFTRYEGGFLCPSSGGITGSFTVTGTGGVGLKVV